MTQRDKQVAEIYCAAVESGRAPVRAVRDRFAISLRTATNYVASARKAGLIPSEHGNALTRLAPAMRVANALGVSYEALVAAVVEHGTNGRLIVGKSRADYSVRLVVGQLQRQ